MKKISVDILIAVLGTKVVDSFFLNPDWIKRQRRYIVPNNLKYIVYERFGRLEDQGDGVFKGNLELRSISPQVLHYLPKINKLYGDFAIDSNQLTTLEGSPNFVVGDFSCQNNQLSSLEGCPVFVEGDFDCYDNQLKNLDGISKEIKGRFYCDIENIERTPDGKTYRLVES